MQVGPVIANPYILTPLTDGVGFFGRDSVLQFVRIGHNAMIGGMSGVEQDVIPYGLVMGGRASLIGPTIGAFFVNGAKSWFTQAFPEFWLYFLGALFVVVTLFLPQGLLGLWQRVVGKRP